MASSPFSECRVGKRHTDLLVKPKDCKEFTETAVGCMARGRGQRSVLPHVHIQLTQHPPPTVQHLDCRKSGDSTHTGPVLDFVVC